MIVIHNNLVPRLDAVWARLIEVERASFKRARPLGGDTITPDELDERVVQRLEQNAGYMEAEVGVRKPAAEGKKSVSSMRRPKQDPGI